MAERTGLLQAPQLRIFDEAILSCGRQSGEDINTLVRTINMKDSEVVCQSLVGYTRSCLKSLEIIEDDASNDIIVLDDNTIELGVVRLKGVTALAHSFTFENEELKPKSLIQVIELLHELLIPLDDAVAGVIPLKNSISRICEHWWIKNEPGAENLIPQLLPYLLITSLNPDAHDSDIKRVYAIRLSQLLLDFDDESIDSVKSLLLRCLIHPSYLKLSEGKKFLAFLFSINKSFQQQLFEAMRPQLATGTAVIAEAYGEILYRTWKDAKASKDKMVIDSIEDLVQQFIHQAIHAASPKYFKAIRQLMGTFHVSKRNADTDAMLLRVYGPILWRSLRCANGIVRSQAACLFFDCFPLKNDEAPAAEIDEILQKQFDLFVQLLKDEDHRVRIASVYGVCNALQVFWEVLPSNIKHQCITLLVGTLAIDSSSSAVRLAVVQSIASLLEHQPLAHVTLKKMLPLLAQCIHDNSEAVRVAFVQQLLCRVKTTQGISFYDIVPVEHLLYRLTEDRHKAAMCNAMAELLCDSLVPTDEELLSSDSSVESEQIQRCLQLVKSHPIAAECIYAHLHKQIGTKQVTKLAILLYSFVCTFSLTASENKENATSSKTNKKSGKQQPKKSKLQATKRSRQQKESNDNEETESGATDNDNSDAIDEKTRLAVLKIVFVLLQSIQTKLTAKTAKAQYIKSLQSCFGVDNKQASVSDELESLLIDRCSSDATALQIFMYLIRIQYFCNELVPKDATSKSVLRSNASYFEPKAQEIFGGFVEYISAEADEGTEESADSSIHRSELMSLLVSTLFAVDQHQMLLEWISESLKRAAVRKSTAGGAATAAGVSKRRRDKHESSQSEGSTSRVANLPLPTAVALLAAIVEYDRANSAFSLFPSSSSSVSGSTTDSSNGSPSLFSMSNLLMDWAKCAKLLQPVESTLWAVVEENSLVSKPHTISDEDIESTANTRTAALRCAHLLASMKATTELHSSLTSTRQPGNETNIEVRGIVDPIGNSLQALLPLLTQQILLCTDKLTLYKQRSSSTDASTPLYFDEMTVECLQQVSVVLSVLSDAMKAKLGRSQSANSDYQIILHNFARSLLSLLDIVNKVYYLNSRKKIVPEALKSSATVLSTLVTQFSFLMTQKGEITAVCPQQATVLILLNALRPLAALATNGECAITQLWPKSMHAMLDKCLETVNVDIDQEGEAVDGLPSMCIGITDLKQSLLLQCM